MIFLPGLTNPNVGVSARGAYGVMFYGLGSTGTGGYKEPAGPTLDQVVGTALPAAGGRVSLNLSVMIDKLPTATTQPEFCRRVKHVRRFFDDEGRAILSTILGDHESIKHRDNPLSVCVVTLRTGERCTRN